MRKFLCAVGLTLALLAGAIVHAQEGPGGKAPIERPKAVEPLPAAIADVPQYLQDVSVTISCGRAQGSGTFFVSKDGQVWVWTCGHLVDDVRQVRKGDGDNRTYVEFADAKLIKVLVEDGRKIGEYNLDAEVIRYSDATFGHDLALLRVRSKKFKPAASAAFWTEDKIPPIGTELYHCGSLLGVVGSNSLTAGIMSQHGRILLRDKIFDQTTCTAFPGSSGGIVCEKKSGKYVGMVVRGAGEGFNFIVPVRRMKEWAKKVGIEFALDANVDVPTEEKLRSQPIDDSIRASDTSKPGGEQKPTHTFLFPLQPREPEILFPEPIGPPRAKD